MSAQDILKQLREDINFKEILNSATDVKERQAIAAHTEQFVAGLYESVFSHIEKALSEDPDAIKKALLEIERDIIKQEEQRRETLSQVEEDAERNANPRKSD